MSKIKLLSLLLIGLLSFDVVFAESNSHQETKTRFTESKLSKAQIRHAESWELSFDEYEQYLEIMDSPRAYFTPNLEKNPLLALALESKSVLERQKYADRWVNIQYENNIKVISWQLDVSAAWERNYPGIQRFNYKKPELNHLTIQGMLKNNPTPEFLPEFLKNKQQNRAHVYISLGDCGGCAKAFETQYQSLKKGMLEGVDVFFVGDASKKQIIEWAISNKLASTDVNDKRIITLNVAENTPKNIPFVEFK